MASVSNYCIRDSLEWLKVFGKSNDPAVWLEFMRVNYPYINCKSDTVKNKCLLTLWEREKIVWYGTENALNKYAKSVVNSVCIMYSSQMQNFDLLAYFEGLGMNNPTAAVIGAIRSKSTEYLSKILKKYDIRNINMPLIFTEVGIIGYNGMIDVLETYVGMDMIKMYPYLLAGASIGNNTNIMDEFMEFIPINHRVKFLNSLLIKATIMGSCASIRWLLSNGANSREDAKKEALMRGKTEAYRILDDNVISKNTFELSDDFDITEYISDPVYSDDDTSYFMSSEFMENIGSTQNTDDEIHPCIIDDDDYL
jgi:hypothetical protein